MLLNRPAPQPNTMYIPRPISVRVFALQIRHIFSKNKFVTAMNTAGMLIISCTIIFDSPLKYSCITPSAGATAAPAITVSSDSVSIATINFHLLCSCRNIFTSLQKIGFTFSKVPGPAARRPGRTF